jgi:hypothetical protein
LWACDAAQQPPGLVPRRHGLLGYWAAGLAGAPVTLAAPLVPSPELDARVSTLGVCRRRRLSCSSPPVAGDPFQELLCMAARLLGCLVAWSLDCWLLDACWSPTRLATTLVKSDVVLCTARDRQSLAQVVTRGEMREDGAPPASALLARRHCAAGLFDTPKSWYETEPPKTCTGGRAGDMDGAVSLPPRASCDMAWRRWLLFGLLWLLWLPSLPWRLLEAITMPQCRR